MQFLAMLTMLIDHIGYIFFPQEIWLRIVGRIAFPLYAWFLYLGYTRTSNLRRYMIRLWILAVFSQVPFSLAFDTTDLNVIVTLALALTSLYFLDKIQSKPILLIPLITVFAITYFVPMDYGLYGVALVIIYRYMIHWQTIVAHLVLNIVFWLQNGSVYWLQMFSIMATILIVYQDTLRTYVPSSFKNFRVHPYVYRSFYPVHLLILYLLFQVLN